MIPPLKHIWQILYHDKALMLKNLKAHATAKAILLKILRLTLDIAETKYYIVTKVLKRPF